MKDPKRPEDGVLKRASDHVAAALRRTIFDGELGPGDRLPPERALAARFQVTRNTIREALRQLEQLRLVTIRRGSGVRVEDYRASAGLDLLAKLLTSDVGATLRDDVMEVRAVVGRAISCFAALRFDSKALPQLRAAVEAFEAEASAATLDRHRLQTRDFEVHARLIRGSGNLALVMLYNSLRYLCERIESFLEPLLANATEIAALYREAVDALGAGDRARAARAFESVFVSQWPALERGMA